MKPPKILQAGELKKINDHLYAKTGCFAFLVPDAQWIYPEPKSGKEAFERWSIELYTVYHDHGCGYLPYLLSGRDICPGDLRRDLSKAKRHMDSVNKIFRKNLAHGLMDVCSRDRMKKEISRYHIKKDKGEKWDLYFQSLTDDDWKRAAEHLRADADALLETLYKWADVVEKDRDISDPREAFGRAREFRSSISRRIVFDSLDNDLCSTGGPSALKILDGGSKKGKGSVERNSEKQLQEWQDEIQKGFLSGKIKTAEDIVSELKRFLYRIHEPLKDSSIAIADRTGFSLDGF